MIHDYFFTLYFINRSNRFVCNGFMVSIKIFFANATFDLKILKMCDLIRNHL